MSVKSCVTWTLHTQLSSNADLALIERLVLEQKILILKTHSGRSRYSFPEREDNGTRETFSIATISASPYQIRQTNHTLKMRDSTFSSASTSFFVIDSWTWMSTPMRKLSLVYSWYCRQQFKSGLTGYILGSRADAFMSTIISRPSSSMEPNHLAPYNFESCAARIISEASRLVNMPTIASSRPETE